MLIYKVLKNIKLKKGESNNLLSEIYRRGLVPINHSVEI